MVNFLPVIIYLQKKKHLCDTVKSKFKKIKYATIIRIKTQYVLISQRKAQFLEPSHSSYDFVSYKNSCKCLSYMILKVTVIQVPYRTFLLLNKTFSNF